MTARFCHITAAAIVFIACPLIATAGEPQPSATPVAWELSIQPAPLMRISVNTGKGSSTYWYMIYTVTNNSGQDVDFNPEIVRVSEIETDTGKTISGASPTIMTEPAIVGVDNKVFKAIADRHSKTYPFIVTPVKAIDRLLQGRDNARTSVAVFSDLDPRVSRFTIYVGGLSGERIARPNPGYDAARESEPKDNPKLFVLQKTLVLPYTLPGDLRTRRSAEPVLGKMGWVMR